MDENEGGKSLIKTENEVAKKKDRTPKGQPDYGCKPSFFWYSFFGTGIVMPLARLVFGMKIRTDKRIKEMEGPLVIVGNHPSSIDPIIMATTVRGRPINFVAGTFLFRNKIFAHIITKGGCIPKAQFRNDMRTVRAMFRVLSRGGVLGIFPEATRMVDGHSIPFDSGLASLIKKNGAAVAILRSHGAYMTWPRWSENSWRKGRITAEYVHVITKEEVAEMSVQEIHQVMLEHLDYNEYEYFRSHPQVFRSKDPLCGIENVACICPRCRSMNAMRAENGKILRCVKCGNTVNVDKYGFFTPSGEEDKCFPDLHEWNRWEQTIYEESISSPDFVLTEKVTLFQPLDEFLYAKVGEGVLTIRDGEITFEGKACRPEEGIAYKKGKPLFSQRKRDISKVAVPVNKTFKVKFMKGLMYDFGEYLELFEPGGQINRFYPENRSRIHEICGIIRAMHNQIES
ncbi:MAG: 1-acyl-sn-glycerol-3-phosphate acyltransferase [Clostridiales bacterium]|nr:1-acyl-sn-glycerol-3-phosphate acyltransferase [Clostridiales bacterium]